ncbi:MAG TPA: ABC transporter permease [Thermomicrobiales bacterium]|nr:ABC transporter permease [Thermomicrobiales bacterium]
MSLNPDLTVGPAPPIAPAPEAKEAAGPAAAETRVAVASQWQLMRWRFRKHKLAVVSLWVIALLYIVALFAEFLAPVDPNRTSEAYKYVSPQRISFVDSTGRVRWWPGVYGLKSTRDPVTLRVTYVPDTSRWYPFEFFTRGPSYKLWGVIPSDLHLFGLGPRFQDQPLYLFGSDRLGRDMLSRIIYGTRISLSIGLVSVALSLVLGIALGGISGYFGGTIDNAIQRVIEFIRSLPTIPLWMALGAAVPPGWSPVRVYFAITIILSLIGWTGLARVVRGRFLSLREEDFIMAARFCGASEARIIFRHMVPSFLSHIIASLTLAIPGIILFETALSFLGLGLRPPIISWGVLLQEAQNVQTVALSPWLLAPGVAVVLAVLAFNFLGDGLRDAADPYGR